jgi:hypothetical protein
LRVVWDGCSLRPSIPPAGELAAVCRELIDAWHRDEPPLDWQAVCASFAGADGGWPDAVERLCLINCFQWHLEDACRASYADSYRLAELKRDIDASNGRRVWWIGELDERLLAELGVTGGASAPVAAITPGNLLDRITILELKRCHAGGGRGLQAMLDEQIGDACDALDRLVSDLACGRQRVKRYRTVKLYPGADG